VKEVGGYIESNISWSLKSVNTLAGLTGLKPLKVSCYIEHLLDFAGK